MYNTLDSLLAQVSKFKMAPSTIVSAAVKVIVASIVENLSNLLNIIKNHGNTRTVTCGERQVGHKTSRRLNFTYCWPASSKYHNILSYTLQVY